MMIKLTGGKVYDPANNINGEVRDIYVARRPHRRARTRSARRQGIRRAAAASSWPAPSTRTPTSAAARSTIARMLMPEDHEQDEVAAHGARRVPARGHALPSTLVTGYRYAEMGYTACFEPAMLPANARQAHMEMGDMPMLDNGAYVMLGSDDLLLRPCSPRRRLRAHQRLHRLDDARRAGDAAEGGQPGRHQRLQVQPAQARPRREARALRQSRRARSCLTLARGAARARRPHPLHIHGCNLGVPGNIETTLATIARSKACRCT